MGISNVVNMAAHLTNASRAKLGLTSVPVTKANLQILLAMHKAGYLSFVTRGNTAPPDLDNVPTYVPEPLTNANVSNQRLWLGLKYINGEPVLRHITSISKPKRPITAKLAALDKLVRGFDANYQRGLSLGESLFVRTDRGTMEAREAVEKKLGGLLMCRVSS
ncbi:ribosomal protein S8 [Xylaria sp. CBS 124048]|nr:ribosomal protein S8 [Xylaria sp. CBS 124048]